MTRVFKTLQVPDRHLSSNAKVLPTNLIKETLLSLTLLFPNWDPRTEAYLRKTHRTLFIGGSITSPKQLHLMDFFYWRDRLAELHTESQSYPTNWRLMWRDRRNPLQWYTFWFAVAVLIFTVIFGTIASVTACMTTVYTWQTLKLARVAAKSPPMCVCPQ